MSVTSTPIVVRFVQCNFTKSDKSRVILMLIILVVDFKGFTKTSFVSKLKEHPGKVHIAIVVGTRNVGHLKRRGAIPTEANGSRTGRGM